MPLPHRRSAPLPAGFSALHSDHPATVKAMKTGLEAVGGGITVRLAQEDLSPARTGGRIAMVKFPGRAGCSPVSGQPSTANLSKQNGLISNKNLELDAQDRIRDPHCRKSQGDGSEEGL